MKRIITLFLLVLLALTPLSSHAELTADDYVTLGELRQQALAGWHQTYTARGREVVANVDIAWMPDAESCPILHIRETSSDADPALFTRYDGEDNRVTLVPETNYIHVMVDMKRESYFLPGYSGGTRGLWDHDSAIFPYSAIPDCQPENLDCSFQAFCDFVNSHIEPLTGLSLDDYLCKTEVAGVQWLARNKEGRLVRLEPMTRNGSYFLSAQQLLHGIPMANDRNVSVAPSGCLTFSYYNDHCYLFGIQPIAVTGILNDDVPLLSFDAIRKKLVEQIETGNLRGIDEMEFCYVPFYQEGADDGTWIVQPVWRLLGGYAANADNDENVLPYSDPRDKDGSISVPAGYANYYFNAQTGELIKTSSVTQDDSPLNAQDILTWADVGGSQ